MKNGFRILGPLTFVCGLVMITLSLVDPAKAAPRVPAGGIWVDYNTLASFPPGIPPLIQDLDANLNRGGGADSAVYVPELHRLFAHYPR